MIMTAGATRATVIAAEEAGTAITITTSMITTAGAARARMET